LVAYLYFFHTPEEVPQLWINTTWFIFLGTVSGIGYVYYRVAKLVFSDPLDDLTLDQVQKGVEFQLRESDRQGLSQSILDRELPEFVSVGSNRDGRVLMS
jgi:hypothetical protein